MSKALRTIKNEFWSEVSLVFVDDEAIRKINRKHLASDSITDVISFRYDPVPGLAEEYQGEVFINVQRAIEIRGVRWSISRELALYIAHGCDHLVGHDDHSRAEYLSMRRRELRWLRLADENGLIEGIASKQ